MRMPTNRTTRNPLVISQRIAHHPTVPTQVRLPQRHRFRWIVTSRTKLAKDPTLGPPTRTVPNRPLLEVLRWPVRFADTELPRHPCRKAACTRNSMVIPADTACQALVLA